MDNPTKTIARRRVRAEHKTIFDDDEDSIVDEWVGGNVDDAYKLGREDGKVELAREILAELGLLGAE